MPVTHLATFAEARAPWIAASVMLVAALATMTSDPIGVFNDDGIYLLTAKALAEGQGYVYPQIPGTPPAIHYPPLWPVLLAAVWKVAPVFPASVPWFKLLNPLILAASAALFVRLLRDEFGFSPLAALAVTLLACVSIPLLILGNLLLSEPLFLLLLLVAVPVTERAVRDGGTSRALLAAAAAGALILTRTLGGVIAIAAVLHLARRGKWRVLLPYAAVTAAILLPWQFFVAQGTRAFPQELGGSYGPYLAWAIDGYRAGGWALAGANLAANASASWQMLAALVAPYPWTALRAVVAVVALLFLALGAHALWRADRARVLLVALLGYVAVALAWPFLVDRFLWIVWPLVVAIGARGATHPWLTAERHRLLLHARSSVGAIVCFGLVAYLVIEWRAGGATRTSHEIAGAGIRLARRVNEDRRLDGKVLASELAPLVALYSGEQVLPVELLVAGEHLRDKTITERAAGIEGVDRRFRPAAYIVMSGGPFNDALLAARLDSGRVPVSDSLPGIPVRTFLIQTP